MTLSGIEHQAQSNWGVQTRTNLSEGVHNPWEPVMRVRFAQIRTPCLA